jgi:2-phosphosulfolactate phosphatase
VPERVRGRLLITTTTNGTRALRACAGARQVWIGALVNLAATAAALRAAGGEEVLLVASGTGEEPALEDLLASGALIARLRAAGGRIELSDAARVVEAAYQHAAAGLGRACREAGNARHLLALPELAADVDWCLELDRLPLVASLDETGILRLRS